VATGGRAPALAKAVCLHLQSEFGQEWALLVEIAARLRTEKLTGSSQSAYDYKVFVELLDAGLADLLVRREETAINHLLTRVCDQETTLAGLGLTLPDQIP
jgi:precorrin-2 dehydrogenase